jgi:hypothetical protein
MPGALQPAAPTHVLPQGLATSFQMTRVFPILTLAYHDGTVEGSLITDTVNPPRPARVWRTARRMPVAKLIELRNFWETVVFGGAYPFWFYDPYDIVPPNCPGSNYDATGASTQGRVSVFFRGNWKETISGPTLSDVADLVLVEVA